MNVYPVNAIEAATLHSAQKEAYVTIEDIHNKIISYQVDFNTPVIELTGTWNELVEIDSIIIGNTNATSGKIELYDNSQVVFDCDFDIKTFLHIINILDKYKKPDSVNVNNFKLTLSGNENINIGYLFMGLVWELPRFVVNPAKALQLRNESGRTFYGNVTGIPIETLRGFSVSYKSKTNEEKKLFDDYINGVQTVIPHVIDLYPLAHDEFEPFFATVAEYSEATKRDEPGFFWDFSCSWQEAR